MCFDDPSKPFVLDFKPKVTIVHGSNGSGKSTLIDALQVNYIK